MTKLLTQEQAIETWTELQRRVSVGAYLELQHDGSYPEDDGTPESTTLESIANLEKWAAKQGLEFCWNVDRNFWHLTPIEPGEDYDTPDTPAGDIGNPDYDREAHS